jgi:probable rRNA maturation factor
VTIEVCFDVPAPAPGEGGLDEQGIARAVETALRHGGRPDLWVSVAIVSAATLSELHDRYLDDPSETDVMTFELGEDEPGPAGEIVFSLERARTVAGERSLPLAREMALYSVHGALHLCGFDDHDEADRRRMRSAEREVLEQLGFAPERLPHDLDDPS